MSKQASDGNFNFGHKFNTIGQLFKMEHPIFDLVFVKHR